MSAKIAVITWSLYGHVAELANDAIEGAKAAGAEVKQFQVSVPAMKKRKASNLELTLAFDRLLRRCPMRC